MENIKCIGLVMAYTGTSYGMNLQAFATQHVIEQMGYSTEIIPTLESTSSLKNVPFDWGLLIYAPKMLIKRLTESKRPKELYPVWDDLHAENKRKRVEAAKGFRSRYLHSIGPKMSFDKLAKYSEKYDAVLIGSDQCWLPGFSFSRRSSLSFVPDKVRRLSYATSLGVSAYPWYLRSSSRKSWKRFDFVSVREEAGRKIIKDICGENFPVELVVDPTYLISYEEWLQLIPEKRMNEKKYVLSFILGNNKDQMMCAKRFAQAKGLELVSILSNESSADIDTTYPDRVVIGASPDEFVNYVRGAEIILTDSFHGIAFSVINKKQLFVYYRKRRETQAKYSRNSRIDNILQLWQIRHRLITDYTIDWQTSDIKEINYAKVDALVEQMRNHSFEYLHKALP